MMRASVVFPTPGGPHRMIEAAVALNRLAQRLAGPEDVLLADDLVQRAGRIRSASGVPAAGVPDPRNSLCGSLVVFVRK